VAARVGRRQVQPRGGRYGGRLGVLAERDFRLFFIGYSTSLAGSAMVPVALAFAVLQAGRGPADVGYVLAAQTLPLVVLLLVGGVVADRLSRRTVMIASDLARCASEALLAVLLLTGSPPLWLLMVLAGVLGAGQAFFAPALTGLIPLVTSPERLQQANALKGVATSAGQIAGPAVAGLIVAAGGAGWAIAVDAATYAVSALCLARLHLPAHVPPPAERVISQLRTGWREFRSRTWLWLVVGQFSLFHLLVYAPFVVLGAVIEAGLPGGAAAWGIILTAQGAGSVLGGIAVMSARPKRPLVIGTLGTFAFAGPVALLALRAPAGWIAAAAAVSGAGLAVFGALWDTAMQRNIPAAVLSRVSAYDWLGSVALVPLGLALAGPLASAFGITAVLWLAAGWNVLGSALVLAVPSVRRLPGGGDGRDIVTPPGPRRRRVPGRLQRADGREHHQQEGGQRSHAVSDRDEGGEVPLGPPLTLTGEAGPGLGEDVIGEPGR
jgi:MFS family permease